VPTLVNIDKSSAKKAGIEDFNTAGQDAAPVEVRQRTYLNNIVERDHRNIKWRIRSMLGFKSFGMALSYCAASSLVTCSAKGQLVSAA
jgi:transposase-like protein